MGTHAGHAPGDTNGAIRAVRRLIARETDTQTLARGAVLALVEHGAVHLARLVPGLQLDDAEAGHAGPDDERLTLPLPTTGDPESVLLLALPRADDEARAALAELAEDLGFALARLAEAGRAAIDHRTCNELFAHMRNGFAHCRMIFDGEVPVDFVYLQVNDAFSRQTGLRDVCGRRASEVIPGLRRTDQALLDVYGKVARGGAPERLEIFVNALGDWFEISAYRTAPDHFAAVFDVITERKRSEKEHEESRARLASVLSSIDDLVFGIDAEGRFIDYHAPSESALYVPPSVFLGRHYADILPREVSDQLRATIAGVAATGRPGQFDYRLDIAGEPRWWSVKVSARDSAGARAYTVVSREVTARTLAAAALQEREAELLAIVDMAPIGIAQAESTTRRLVRVNERMCAITGYATDELLGRDLGDITHAEDRERDRALFEGLVRGDWPEYRTEKRYLRKDGGTAWVRINATMLRDAAGRPMRTLATIEDLSAQRATEEQLRVAQKMEAVGRLAGGVAHDFNNLLTVILSYTEFARDDLPPDAPLRADLAEIEQAARRAEALTRQLLAFGRRQPQRAEPIVVSELVQDVSKLLRRLIGEDIELVVSASPEPAEILADRGQMEQVLMNLAVNARDAMPDGGRVTIHSAAVELDGALASQVGPGPHVEISVSDTGHGMDAATRERIFEPFFTTKPVGKGTGLGLSTVYGIVKQSGGCVVVESAAGQGATFRIYLPQRARTRLSTPPPIASAAVGGNETLLLVEDEDALRRAACRILGSAGYEVLSAANATEALAIAAARTTEIRLIITDVVMPGMNGKELAGALHSLCPSALVLFTSGYTDDAIARHGVLGPHFLPKPYAKPQLTAMVRRLLDTR